MNCTIGNVDLNPDGPAARVCLNSATTRNWVWHRALRAACLVLVLCGLGGCETTLSVPQDKASLAGQPQSIASAQNILANATGKYCPDLLCGVNGYQISAIQLADHGQTLIFVHTDGSRGDSLPVQSLNPRGGSIMGLGAVHFTGEFAPNLVTTEVEAARLITALKTIRQAPGVALASRAGQQMATGVAHAQTTNPAGSAAQTAPSVSSAAASQAPVQSTPATSSQANAPTHYAGKRLAIRMAQNCSSDPDPLGIVSSDLYSRCAESTLSRLQRRIAAALAAKGIFGSVGNASPSLTLTVTLTQMQATQGVVGMFIDLVPYTLEFTATYQITNASGQVVASGKVHHEQGGNSGSFGGENGKAALQAFATKIAAAVAASGATNAPAIHGPGPGQPRFGISISNLTPQAALRLGHRGLTGALVVKAAQGSPAAKAGIRPGDVIYQMDGHSVTGARALVKVLAAEPSGKLSRVKLWRGKKNMNVTVHL